MKHYEVHYTKTTNDHVNVVAKDADDAEKQAYSIAGKDVMITAVYDNSPKSRV